MSRNDLWNIGNAYEDMLNGLKRQLVKEGKHGIKPGGNDFNDPFAIQDGGLDEKGGARKVLNDKGCGCSEEDEEDYPVSKRQQSKYDTIEDLKKKLKDDSLSDEEKKKIQDKIKDIQSDLQAEEGEEEEKELNESRKNGRKILNTVMTRKTLSFDNLYKSVINESWGEDAEEVDDVEAFDLEDEPTDTEFGDEDFGDEVTITLDKDLAQKLHDVLMAAIGGEEDTDEGEDFGGELDFGDEDLDDEGGEEDEEAPYTSKDNKVTKKVAPKSQSANSSVTDKVGDDGDYGHALVNAKQPNIGSGTGNKVGKYKQGGEFIQ